MSDTFDFGRFSKLFKYECLNYLPRYVKGMLVFAGFIVASWAFSIKEGYTINDRTDLIAVLLNFAVLLSPYFVYSDINNSKKGYLYAIIPASTLEKLLSMSLMCMVVVPVCAFVALTATDVLLWLFSMMGIGGFKEIAFLDLAVLLDYRVIISAIAFVATPMMFNAVFRSHKILKTLLFFLALFFALVFGVSFIVSALSVNLATERAFEIWLGRTFGNCSAQDVISFLEIILSLFNAAIACVTLAVTYRRIKKMDY